MIFSTLGGDQVATTAVWWEWYVRLGLETGGKPELDLYFEAREARARGRPLTPESMSEAVAGVS